jgi:glycosyltransferase involved in cell wall biosynthesis
MQRCRVLVINDFTEKGGADEVYRQSAELLRAMPGVDVECFDQSTVSANETVRPPSWNFAAASALAKVISNFRPHRVLVHNYHNFLSTSVLGVIARYKRELGYTTFLTCHDYHLVYYNPNLLHYAKGHGVMLPLDVLRTRHAMWLRSSPKGLAHDLLKKGHWHAMRTLIKPERVFDAFLCPSSFMQDALRKGGIDNTVLLFNPASVTVAPRPPKVRTSGSINLAFVGRVAPEKGLAQFIELAQALDFPQIDHLAIYGDGPERAIIEERFPSLINSGKVAFLGRLPQEELFAELRRTADAIVLPSVWPENAPLAIIEAAMLGLPALVHDVGSLSTFGDEVGNKIKFCSKPETLRSAMDRLTAHLATPMRQYDVSEYSSLRYGTKLAQIMRIGEQSMTSPTEPSRDDDPVDEVAAPVSPEDSFPRTSTAPNRSFLLH